MLLYVGVLVLETTQSKFEIVIPHSLAVIVLAIAPKVQRFKPGQGRWICKGNKNL
jgi:hypothetical protein